MGRSGSSRRSTSTSSRATTGTGSFARSPSSTGTTRRPRGCSTSRSRACATRAGGRALTHEIDRNGANVRIRIGDADRFVRSKQAYRIAYRVRGALEGYADHDELYWNVNGFAWPVPTREVTATVRLPEAGLTAATCFQGRRG
ncbi:MAG: DUF2207 domain-containing protein, partial [Chloroflexi bacterium]|nr:DUF2207 domain-containing protein [Chloroflexota bacterium]